MKKFTKFLSVLLIATLLVACGKQEAPAPKEESGDASKDKGEITVLVPEWGAPSDEMLAKFKEETGITANVETQGWDEIKQKIGIASAGNTAAADVFEVDWSWVGEFVAAGWLEKLDLSDEVKNDIASIPYFTVEGNVYSLPFINDYRIAYLNTQMAGDKVPATYDELNEILLQAKKDGKVEYPILFPLNAEEKTSTSFMTLVFTRNGVFLNDDNTANEAAIRDGFETLDYQLKNGLIDPNEASRPGVETFKGIVNGEGAFLIGPSAYVNKLDDPEFSKVVGQVKTIMLPGKDGVSPNTLAFTEALGVSAFSKNKEKAMKFIEFMSRDDIQQEFHKEKKVVPTRVKALSALIEDGTIANPGTLLNQAKTIANPFPNGVPSYYTEMSTSMFNIVNEFALGKLSVDEATEKFVTSINSFVK